MADFNEYIATDGRYGDADAALLDDLLARYEWFSVARTVRAHLRGTTDPRSAITAASRGVSSLDFEPIDIPRLLDGNTAVEIASSPEGIANAETVSRSVNAPVCDEEPNGDNPCAAGENEAVAVAATASQDDVIERFLHLDNYRIVADENAPDEEILTEARLSDEDDVVSEELAEVYLSQGLRDEACAIYRKLSLLNPKKSVYFAEIIEKIENNN